ncbi:MAG: DNA (cytosine-5-)-methyltransferase [Eubacteriales bacterium]|nr:DNA (cytosine-5-)-methyltransferase [Eubacteriales bacterium]
MELTHLSLFSGIGGLDLAAEWAGFTTVGQCEWADYPAKVLKKHWPDVERWKDIRTLTGESFYERTGRRTVDVISGGFPCQPFSVAGKQRGKEDDRYLWPEMVRVIKELRPTWIVGENVAGIVRMALPDILSELEACGYWTRTFLIPACAVGARHRRYRVAIVAYSDSTGREEQHSSSKPDEPGFFSGRCDARDVRNATGKGLPDGTSQQMEGYRAPEQKSERSSGNVPDTDNGSRIMWGNGELPAVKEAGEKRNDNGEGTEKHEPGKRRATQPGLGRMADGISGGVDGNFIINHYFDVEPDIPRVAAGVRDRVGRLQALGNAVVPQQFYPIFKAIAEIETMNEIRI